MNFLFGIATLLSAIADYFVQGAGGGVAVVVGAGRAIDAHRRNAKKLITLFVFHFVAMVAIQVAIQTHVGKIMHPANTYFGIVWMGILILIVWLRGGLQLDALIGAYIATDNAFARTATRVLIGFITVESFINICASLIPMYANPGAAGFLLMSTASYFLYRMMAGLIIDWGKWSVIPLINIGVAVVVLVFSAFHGISAPHMSFKSWMIFGMLAGIALTIYGSFFSHEDKQSSTSTATAAAVSTEVPNHE